MTAAPVLTIIGVPEPVADVLHHLVTTKGGLDVEDILRIARDPGSPLHRYFDWNDTTAAEAWRREQAGTLIRRVRIVRSDSTGNTYRVRAFVARRDVEGRRDASSTGQYMPIEDAAEDEAALLAAIQRDVDALLRKYRGTQALLDILSGAVDDLS